MSTQTVKTRLVTLLQIASILHELLTNPACYFRRKVPGKMLHLDMPFHWKPLLTTKRTFLTLTTCSWGYLSTPLYPRWSAAYHRGINCCSRGHLSIPLHLQWGSVYHRNNSWCCSHLCMSERTHLAVARYFQGLQFSSWASTAEITRFNGWSLCCSIWAADDTVSNPILTILSTSRLWPTRMTTRCRVSTVSVDPPPPIGFIPSVSLFWYPPGLHLPLWNLPDCWSMPPLMLLTLCPHTLSLVPQTITQSPPGLMPNISLPMTLLPALLPIVKLAGLIPSGIPSSCLLSTGDLSLLIALVSSLTTLLCCHHPRSAVRLVGPCFHCQQGSFCEAQKDNIRPLLILPCSVLVPCILRVLSTYTELVLP